MFCLLASERVRGLALGTGRLPFVFFFGEDAAEPGRLLKGEARRREDGRDEFSLRLRELVRDKMRRATGSGENFSEGTFWPMDELSLNCSVPAEGYGVWKVASPVSK